MAPAFRETTLPNGETIAHLNEYETQFLYEEIYVQEVYLKHVAMLPEDAVFLDVGANIGLFALFMCDRFPRARVICFEPAPQLLAILRHNVARHGERIVVVPEGIADRPATVDFTYYPDYSIMSGFEAHAGRDEALLKRATARHLERHGIATVDDRILEALAVSKLRQTQVVKCRVETLSHHIARLGIDRVDLLKVDVERAELAVLRGIEAPHWPIIRRVHVEVHDSGELQQAQLLLEVQGFSLIVEAAPQLDGVGVFSISAWRP